MPVVFKVCVEVFFLRLVGGGLQGGPANFPCCMSQHFHP
jgi:hypothetical protein